MRAQAHRRGMAATRESDLPTDMPTPNSFHRARSWPEIVAPYARADRRRALAQLLNTGLPFLLLMAALLHGARNHPWLVTPLAHAGGPASGSLLHHPARLRSRLVLRIAAAPAICQSGRSEVLTLTPYVFWRRSAADPSCELRQASTAAAPAEITVLTVREYQALSLVRQLIYRAYRHPAVLFGLGPFYMFVVRNRIPTGSPIRQKKVWGSAFSGPTRPWPRSSR